MGDPKKLKKKYESPKKVLDSERIREDHKLRSEYGLKNTREVWTTVQELKRVRREARRLLSLGEEGRAESQPLMNKLMRLGIIKSETTLEDLLALSVRDFLARRLQTVVMARQLARTTHQARQLITHGFIAINGRKASVPSRLITVSEEPGISYFKPIDIEVKEEDASRKKGRKKHAEEEAAPAAGSS